VVSHTVRSSDVDEQNSWFLQLHQTVAASVMVFENFSSISAYRCNLGFLVMYYWAFTEIVIMLFLFVLGVIVAIVAVFCGIVVWLT